jgi:dolichyl-phosphate beta-glucosyltransferase
MNAARTDSDQVYLTVVIPAFNESASIEKALCDVSDHFGPECSWEIIVVDDGSCDGTPDIVEQLARARDNIRLIRNPRNFGKGYCLRAGIANARGELILIADADMSVSISHLDQFIERLNEGCDIIMASRYAKGSVFLHPKLVRQAMGRILNRIVRGLFGLRFTDTQCGFKLLRGELAKELAGKCRVNRFAFDVELLLLARKAGARVLEEPVRCLNAPRSSVRVISDSAIMLYDLLALRFRMAKE